jgi:hypothetical protein
MALGRLPVFRAVAVAYRDLASVAQGMPGLIGTVALVLLAYNLAEAFIPPRVLGAPW